MFVVLHPWPSTTGQLSDLMSRTGPTRAKPHARERGAGPKNVATCIACQHTTACPHSVTISFACIDSASLFVIQRQGKPKPAGETVADLLASDRPLPAGDTDPLNLHRISAGLAWFIANRNTDPPLTIAVTGEWGTGKSSLMNLLYHDLKKRRFQPVWFNAWHHQKGKQLLASLYANIREQAVPPLWHPSGLLFRLRLLFHRGRRNKLAFGALAFLLFAAYPFLESVILSLAGGMFALVKALIAKDSIRQIFSFTDLTVFIPDNWIGALLASHAVAGVWKAIRAFGFSPQNLLAFDSADSDADLILGPGHVLPVNFRMWEQW